MKRTRTVDDTARRQWRKVEIACAGMSAEDVFNFAFRRGWYLSRQRAIRNRVKGQTPKGNES